jgi:hypothetical protein
MWSIYADFIIGYAWSITSAFIIAPFLTYVNLCFGSALPPFQVIPSIRRFHTGTDRESSTFGGGLSSAADSPSSTTSMASRVSFWM